MTGETNPEKTSARQALPPGRLRERSWKRFLRGPDPSLLEELYVPMLGEAVRYDRCCSYFSSSVLSAAARGFARFIERAEALGEKAPRPAVRLVVNEEMTAEDVRGLTETGDTSKLESILQTRFKTPRDLLEKKRLAMLGWLAKRGLLEVRVGVMRKGEGIVHAKFGIASDEAGDAIVFSGSGNESARGLRSNYERLEISTSWDDLERYREYQSEFEALWADIHPDVHTVTLPEALRLRLIKFAPPEPPTTEPSLALERQKAAMIWQFIVEAPYLPNGVTACDATALVDLWPHQRRVVEETSRVWPEGRLLCDEVGMGKTIEAIVVLRRLLAGRGVRRVLILLPAGLLKQWQAELREKGGLVFPRLEGTTMLVWPDDRVEKVENLPRALQQNVLLMSRETARTENNLPHLLSAEPWDLVLLDEAHAARRRKQEEGEFNSPTLLLRLLRELQLRRRARGFLLLSATPMQTHPWEPWDLLSVLGEGGSWLSDFGKVREYYSAIAALQNGRCDLETARKAAVLIASDPEFPPLDGDESSRSGPEGVATKLAFGPPTQRRDIARWLRQGSPLARRMHRSTRNALRRYHELGLLPNAPPTRTVNDIAFDFQDPAERRVYDSIKEYIDKRYKELESEKPGKGFVMTIYRRRASSSPLALERSLKRRRDGLRRVVERKAYDFDLSPQDIPESLDPDDLPEEDAGGRVPLAIPQDARVAQAELVEVELRLADLRALRGRDSKRDKFFEILRQITEDGRPVLIFTEYTDTLEYIRENLVQHYGKAVGCYSGDGGQLWEAEKWQSVTKDRITDELKKGSLRALVCTDAASEGLNLQAAGAVINYDLPWNPSKVEQRIGRIDRIGQKLSEIRVVNLFLENSVDDQVYRVLRHRCGLFEHFVGEMQPVLARARRMLLGQEPADPKSLQAAASEIERDPLARETYIESSPEQVLDPRPVLTRRQLADALSSLKEELGFQLKSDYDAGVFILRGPGLPKTSFSCEIRPLERDRRVFPLSPFSPELRGLVDVLSRPGERLPLTIGSFQQGAFRVSVALWILGQATKPVKSLDELQQLIQEWDGTFPEPVRWQRAQEVAREAATNEVAVLMSRTTERERKMLERQVDAARLRLMRELGRYLVCVDNQTADLNRVWHQQMTRDIASAERLRQCLERLRSWPQWPEQMCRELEEFVRSLSANQRRARLLGSEIDAALQDPRWSADRVSTSS